MIDNNNTDFNMDFTMRIMSELVSYPYVLIKDYKRMGIDEKELIILLRMLHHYFAKGYLLLDDVCGEFDVSPDDAKIMLMPYINKNLIAESDADGHYSCSGVLNCYYEDWILDRRNPAGDYKDSPVKAAGMSAREKKLINALSKLYREFEQELGKNLSPMQSEEIRSWIETDKMPPDMIEEALRRSVMQEKRSFAYIKSILGKWRESGYKTLKQVIDNDIKPANIKTVEKKSNKTNVAKKSKYAEIYDKY